MSINFSNESNGSPNLDGYAMSSLSNVDLTNYSSAVSFLSSGYSLAKFAGYSISIAMSGTFSGTLILQGCNDKSDHLDDADYNLKNWFDITGSSVSVSNGAPDLLTIDHPNAFYRWVRIKYTAITGTITVSIRIQLKG